MQNTNMKIQEVLIGQLCIMQMSILTEWICDRRIALVLRKEPGLVRDFAERLRAKLAMARSAAVVSDNEWEWYICCRWETRQRPCGARIV